jgi:DNA-binding MarR family transcriptional regulator
MNNSASRTESEQKVRRDTAYVLLETVPSVMGFVSSELRRNSPVDNSVHFRLLRTLRRGQCSLHQLAEQHGVRLPTMSRTVSVLEKRGWLERLRSNEDRRTVYAVITPEGEKVLGEVEEMALNRTSELLACLPKGELEKLHSGLSTLFEVVREQLGSGAEEGAVEGVRGCKEDENETT